jgi:hypothetical protein
LSPTISPRRPLLRSCRRLTAFSIAVAEQSPEISNFARNCAASARRQKVLLKIVFLGDFLAAFGAVSKPSLQIRDFRRNFKSSAGNLLVQLEFQKFSGSFALSREVSDLQPKNEIFSRRIKSSAEVLNFRRNILHSADDLDFPPDIRIFRLNFFVSSRTFYFPAELFNLPPEIPIFR